MKLEIAQQADELRTNLDKLDKLIDDLNNKEAANLLETYKSINIILKAQQALLTKPKLSIIRE